jgi:hypothetical protein
MTLRRPIGVRRGAGGSRRVLSVSYWSPKSHIYVTLSCTIMHISIAAQKDKSLKVYF